ncbi:MAG: fumarylacetoacetate hydrolase family protein [Sphaerochaetaceae bacterium]
MKYVRYIKDKKLFWGLLEENKIIEMESSPFEGSVLTNRTVKKEGVKIVAPVAPSKILCVGQNYKEHIKELNREIPTSPVLFLKPPTAIIGPEETIIMPPLSKRVDYEGELAVIIKKEASYIKTKEVKDYILGYTCANDVTARDLQPAIGQWTIAKGFDTFLPLGPAIESEIDPTNLEIRTLHNNKVVQSANTNEMIFDIYYLVSYFSQIMTLLPGDVILTGTPSGIGPMQDSDEIVVQIEGVGKLRNFVKRESY